MESNEQSCTGAVDELAMRLNRELERSGQVRTAETATDGANRIRLALRYTETDPLVNRTARDLVAISPLAFLRLARNFVALADHVVAMNTIASRDPVLVVGVRGILELGVGVNVAKLRDRGLSLADPSDAESS